MKWIKNHTKCFIYYYETIVYGWKIVIRFVKYFDHVTRCKTEEKRKEKNFSLLHTWTYHSYTIREERFAKKRKEKRNLTRISHFSSERRGIRIFRENSGRPSSETRDRAYVCSTLLVEIEFKTWRSLSLFLSLTHLYHFCNPLTSNVVFRSTVTRRRNVFINPRIEIVATSNTFDIFPLDSKVIFYISRFFFLLLNKK